MPDAIGTRVEQPDARLTCHLELDHLAVGKRVRAESDGRRNAAVVRRQYQEAVPWRSVRRARNGWRRLHMAASPQSHDVRCLRDVFLLIDEAVAVLHAAHAETHLRSEHHVEL